MAENILDVCAVELTALRDLSSLITSDRNHASEFGLALPLASHSGLPFTNGLHLPVQHFALAGQELSLNELVNLHASRGGGEVYLVLNPDIQAFSAPFLYLVDSSGDASRQLCFGRARVIQFWLDVIEEAIASLDATARDSIGGFALDLVDLWPMGGSGVRLDLTCFCPDCTETLEGHGVDLEALITSPGPWNLALKDTGSGIDFVGDITPEISADDFVLSVLNRGFVIPEVSEHSANFRSWAETLLAYAHARHALTTANAARILTAVKQALPTCNRTIISETEEYNWTGGTFLRLLDDSNLVDELWIDPAARQSWLPKAVKYRHYLLSRSRYYVDAFFDLLGHSLNRAGVDDLMRTRLEGVLSRRVSHASVRYLPHTEQSLGVVTPLLDSSVTAASLSQGPSA